MAMDRSLPQGTRSYEDRVSDMLGGANAAPSVVPSGDTFTGQMIAMDELIKGYHDVLGRLTRQADALVPENDASGTIAGGQKISTPVDSTPLLFRLQNRVSELYALQSAICQQLNRIDRVL